MRGGYRSIPEETKNIILKQVKEDLRDVSEVASEFEVHPKTIYGWLRKEVDETGRSDASYLREIHQLQREKEDFLQIVGAMTVVVERMKKKIPKTFLDRAILEERNHINKSLLSRLLGVSRSIFSYTAKLEIRDTKEAILLQEQKNSHPYYGHRRLAFVLGWSKKKTRRLMKKFHISALGKKKKYLSKPEDQRQADIHGKSFKDIIIGNPLKKLCPIAPHVVWRSDFTHII